MGSSGPAPSLMGGYVMGQPAQPHPPCDSSQGMGYNMMPSNQYYSPQMGYYPGHNSVPGSQYPPMEGYLPQPQGYQLQPNFCPPQMDCYMGMGMGMGNYGSQYMMGMGNPYSMPFGSMRGRQMDRAPDSISGRWRDEEHELFLKGLNKYGRKWKKISLMVKTRTAVQIRTHAQKFFQSLQRGKDAAAALAAIHGGGHVHGGEDSCDDEDDKISQITDVDDVSSNQDCEHRDKKVKVEIVRDDSPSETTISDTTVETTAAAAAEAVPVVVTGDPDTAETPKHVSPPEEIVSRAISATANVQDIIPVVG